jgi:hypothetical protein
MSKPAPTRSLSGLLYLVARVVGYTSSLVVALYLWVFCSPYKLHYGASGRHYYNDDGILFGIGVSVLLLGLHAVGALVKALLYRQRPSALALAFLTFYLVMACYWVYHFNSNEAMHEY